VALLSQLVTPEIIPKRCIRENISQIPAMVSLGSCHQQKGPASSDPRIVLVFGAWQLMLTVNLIGSITPLGVSVRVFPGIIRLRGLWPYKGFNPWWIQNLNRSLGGGGTSFLVGGSSMSWVLCLAPVPSCHCPTSLSPHHEVRNSSTHTLTAMKFFPNTWVSWPWTEPSETLSQKKSFFP
jgi:hypothetical protein